MSPNPIKKKFAELDAKLMAIVFSYHTTTMKL